MVHQINRRLAGEVGQCRTQSAATKADSGNAEPGLSHDYLPSPDCLVSWNGPGKGWDRVDIQALIGQVDTPFIASRISQFLFDIANLQESWRWYAQQNITSSNLSHVPCSTKFVQDCLLSERSNPVLSPC